MKRVVVFAPGGHDALRLVEEPDPRPGPGQALVAVRAAGVNYADVVVRLGYYEAAKGMYPITPGFEFAGEIEAVGDGVTAFKPGDRVLGVTRFGGYASKIAAPVERLFPVPAGWSLEQAAAFPAVHMTAYYALYRAAAVAPGQTHLVHSAAGGVGMALVQLGRLGGARVIGVVGAASKRAAVEALGASGVIDRSSEDLWARADVLAPEGFDAIFDANGVTTPRPGFERLARGGRLVIYGFAEILPRASEKPSRLALAWNWLRVPRFSPLDMTATNRAVMGFNVVFMFDQTDFLREAMARMLAWAADGSLKPPSVTAFALDRAADAHAALEGGATIGKLVLLA
jgi:NADPH:quinone reductase-like Zn-dependent oxidoreductase